MPAPRSPATTPPTPPPVPTCRPNTANTSQTSVHGTGRAIDVFIPLYRGAADNTLGDPVAHWLVTHAQEIGVQLVIWDRSIWGPSTSPDTRPYTGPHPHRPAVELRQRLALDLHELDAVGLLEARGAVDLVDV